MQLKTILNRVEHFKSFVYGKAKWVENDEGAWLEVSIEAARMGGRYVPAASGQRRATTGYPTHVTDAGLQHLESVQTLRR